jgi:hypothetical protein
MLSRIIALALALATVAAAGCAYSGPTDSATLPGQRATWFSYVGGEDLRAACASGAADRYRLAYNADADRQMRGYDAVPTAAGGVLRQVVDRGITISGPVGPGGQAIGAPIRAEAALTGADLAELGALLEVSGAFDAPPVGIRLHAQEHFWIVSGCRGGRFFLTAYRYPSDRWDRVRFVGFLRARDRTGVPIPAPLPPPRGQRARCTEIWRQGGLCFTLQVGAGGLVGPQSLL